MTPSTDWKETIAPDEHQRFEALAEILRALQRKTARGGTALRALHAKQHVGATAELVIPSDLPPEVRAGLFAQPGTYRVYVRYSNGAGQRQGDHKPDVRGLAVKVVGVPGRPRRRVARSVNASRRCRSIRGTRWKRTSRSER